MAPTDLEDGESKEKAHSSDSSPEPGDLNGGDAGEEKEGAIEEVPPASETELLTAQIVDLKAQSLRKQAEFENYRKRVERERQEVVAYAAGELIREILPIIDNLERAIKVPESGAEDQLREGVSIIYRHFCDILKKAGLEEVKALGMEFDPHFHQAVAHVESKEHKDGDIVEVYQKGYIIKERLLRPAMVTVSKAPESNTDESSADEETRNDTEGVEP